MTVKDHYDKHLGNFYSWMIGNFLEKQLEQEVFFSENNIKPSASKVAFDLGAGHGLQAVSLAKLGFSVKAVDFNDQLLKELQTNKLGYDIDVIKSDLLLFLKNEKGKAGAIVCMGDTLTHLESISQVEQLVHNCSNLLIPKGKIIFSFRDLTTELKNVERFFAVKSDESRILTCFLEYFQDYVLVHDILYEKENGTWKQKVSVYPKLRINETQILKMLSENRIQLINSRIINRMTYLIGEKY